MDTATPLPASPEMADRAPGSSGASVTSEPCKRSEPLPSRANTVAQLGQQAQLGGTGSQAARRWGRVRAMVRADFSAYENVASDRRRQNAVALTLRDVMDRELKGLEKSLIESEGPSQFFHEESKYMRSWDLYMLGMIAFTSTFTVASDHKTQLSTSALLSATHTPRTHSRMMVRSHSQLSLARRRHTRTPFG